MKLITRDFGEIEIDEREIITFASPIFGFEDYLRFVFLYQEDVSRTLVWLQSVDQPEICFILVDPELVAENYLPTIPLSVEKLLGEGEYMCWLVAVLREPFEASTVNLKSPIVVNPVSKRAVQVILEQELPMKHPLLKKGDG